MLTIIGSGKKRACQCLYCKRKISNLSAIAGITLCKQLELITARSVSHTHTAKGKITKCNLFRILYYAIMGIVKNNKKCCGELTREFFRGRLPEVTQYFKRLSGGCFGVTAFEVFYRKTALRCFNMAKMRIFV